MPQVLVNVHQVFDDETGEEDTEMPRPYQVEVRSAGFTMVSPWYFGTIDDATESANNVAADIWDGHTAPLKINRMGNTSGFDIIQCKKNAPPPETTVNFTLEP